MRASSPAPVPLDTVSSLQLPLFSSYIRAGFPNPADDHVEQDIDLNALLMPHPAASFLLRVAGESMIDAGIYPEDIVVVDRSAPRPATRGIFSEGLNAFARKD
jgi:SOS-response transcriptional repressor LexA